MSKRAPRAKRYVSPAGNARDYAVHIGQVIRRARRGRFTLEELAARAEVSSGLISQLERGHGNPSIVTLSKLSYALGLPLGAFFDGLPSEEGRMVVRKDERRELVLPREGGLTFQLLTPDLRRSLAMVLTEYPKGFDNSERPFVHPGEECLFILSGKMDVSVGDQMYTLEAGDSIMYDSGIPHWFKALTTVEVVGAVSPPNF